MIFRQLILDQIHFHYLNHTRLVLKENFNIIKVMLHATIRNDDFLRNTTLQCRNSVVTIRNNVATLCCAKNRRCESSRVTSPLDCEHSLFFFRLVRGVARARASKPRETRAASIHERGHFSISCVSLDGLRKKGRLLVVYNILCHLNKDCATHGKKDPSTVFFSKFLYSNKRMSIDTAEKSALK